MEFKEIVLTKEEYKILSRLTTGETMSYTLSSIKAPYFNRLYRLKLIESEFVQKDGTLDIINAELYTRITTLGENYFLYAKQEKQEARAARFHRCANTVIALVALIVAIMK